MISLLIQLLALIATCSADLQVYIGPERVTQPWRILSPGRIDCSAIGTGLGLESLEGAREFNVSRWTPHMVGSVTGYTCSKIIRRTRCSRSFFGYDSVTKESQISLPPASACADAYQRYREHVNTDVEHPFPECRWLGDTVAESEAVEITISPVSFDPASGSYRDHLLAGDTCVKAPCLMANRKGYWVNTSDPESLCIEPEVIGLFIKGSTNGSVLMDKTFTSLSLAATSFRGGCLKSYCGKPGILLNTREWISGEPSLLAKLPGLAMLPSCSPGTAGYSSVSSGGVLSHVLHAYAVSSELKECSRIRTKLMLNETVSRSDIYHLSPRVIGIGPVYRYNKDHWESSIAKYIPIRLPKTTDGHHGNSLGLQGNTSTHVVWGHPVAFSQDVVDGPNGIFWYRGELVVPGLYGGDISEITESLTKALTRSSKTSGAMAHLPDVLSRLGEETSWTSPEVIRPIAHLSVFWSVVLIIMGILTTWLIVTWLKSRGGDKKPSTKGFPMYQW